MSAYSLHRREPDLLSIALLFVLMTLGFVWTLTVYMSTGHAQEAAAPSTSIDTGSLITTAIAAVTAIVSYALTALGTWLNAKKNNAIFARATEGLRVAVVTAVQTVNQVYVDALRVGREDGKLTDEESHDAWQLALNEAKSLLGAKGIQILIKAYGIKLGFVDDFLTKHIESVVREVKQSDRPRLIPTSLLLQGEGRGGLDVPLLNPHRAT